MIARCIVSCLFLSCAAAQMPEQEDILRMARIRQGVQRHLGAMPNYTCVQTIERFERWPGGQRDALIDVLRLEVAYVGGRELYAWVGSNQFQSTHHSLMTATGTFATGGFVLHARALFVSEEAIFRPQGKDVVDGVPAWRFSYDVPSFRSGYSVQNPQRGKSAVVAYHGQIWVRQDSLELMRISIVAENVPPEIGIQTAREQLDYQLVRIGSHEALLPMRGEVRLIDETGRAAFNRTRLTRCRAYGAESTIQFEDPVDAAPASEVIRELTLEPGTDLELEFEQPLVHGEVAVGDVVQARLKRDVKAGRQVIASRGAVAKGRVMRMEHYEAARPLLNITIEFFEMLGDGWRAPLNLRLLRTEPPSNRPPTEASRPRAVAEYSMPKTDLNGFVWFTRTRSLPRGFTSIWQTQK